MADDRRRTCHDVIRRHRAVARCALSASRAYCCCSTSNCVTAHDAEITTLAPSVDNMCRSGWPAGWLAPSQMTRAVVSIRCRRLSITFHSRTYAKGKIGVNRFCTDGLTKMQYSRFTRTPSLRLLPITVKTPCKAVAIRPTHKYEVSLKHCSEAVCTLPLHAAQPVLDKLKPENGKHTV